MNISLISLNYTGREHIEHQWRLHVWMLTTANRNQLEKMKILYVHLYLYCQQTISFPSRNYSKQAGREWVQGKNSRREKLSHYIGISGWIVVKEESLTIQVVDDNGQVFITNYTMGPIAKDLIMQSEAVFTIRKLHQINTSTKLI